MGSTISVVLMGVAVLMIAIGTVWGLARSWKKSLVALGFNVVSVILAVVITKPISKLAYQFAWEQFIRPELPAELTGNTEMMLIVEGLAVSVVAAVMFAIVYLIVYLLMKIPVAIIGHILKTSEKGNSEATQEAAATKEGANGTWKLVSVAVSLVNAIVFTLVVFSGISGVARTADKAFTTLQKAPESEITSEFDSSYEMVKPVTASPLVAVSGSLPTYSVVTTFSYHGEKTNLDREVTAVAGLMADALEIVAAEEDGLATLDSKVIESIRKDVEASTIVSVLATEAVRDMFAAWAEDETYMDSIDKPEVGAELSKTADALYTSFSDFSKEDLSNLFDTAEGFLDFYKKYDVADITNEPKKLENMLKNEAAVEDVLLLLYDNKKIRPVMGEFANGILSLLCKAMDIDSRDVVTSPADMKGVTREQIKEEAKLLSTSLGKLYTYYNEMDNNANASLATLGEAMDTLGNSIFFGKSSRKLVVALLRSEQFNTYSFISDSMLHKIENGELSMAGLLTLADNAKKISDGNLADNVTSMEDVKAIIADMDEETAAVVTEVVSSQLVDSGVSQKDADAVSDIIMDVLVNSEAAKADDTAALEQEITDKLVSYYEDEANELDAETIENIGAVFGVDVSEFLNKK